MTQNTNIWGITYSSLIIISIVLVVTLCEQAQKWPFTRSNAIVAVGMAVISPPW